MKRLLVYSHDTYGLGNIRRMLAIVEYLIEHNPDCSALILSGSPMLQAFRLSPRIDYVKLPCLERGVSGEYASRFLDLPCEQMLVLRADLILNTMVDFEPDLVLVDKKPLGVHNELAPALELLKRRANRPKLVLVLREILDSPEETIAVWERNDYHETIRDLYDKVLVVGSQAVFDTAEEYQFPKTTREKLEYCGYVVKPRSHRDAESVREELGIGDKSLIVVTTGGGMDGYALLNVALTGFASSGRPPDAHLMVCLGPEMDAGERARLTGIASCVDDVTIIDFTDDMMSYLNAADLVVSMAGYNTVTELLALKKPALLVPRTAPVLEQWMRATRLEKMGLFSVIHPDQMSPRVFLAVLRRMFAESPQVAKAIPASDMRALQRINECVTGLLTDRATKGYSQMFRQSGGVETDEFARLSLVGGARDAK